MLETLMAPGMLSYLLLTVAAVIAFFFRKMWLRYVILMVSLVVIGFLQMGCPSPIGAIQHIFTQGWDVSRKMPYLIKLAIVIVPSLFMGKLFCGWVCHKGALQEFLFQKKLKIVVPQRVDSVLRYLKYIILVALILSPMLFHYKLFNPSTQAFKSFFNLGGPLSALILMGIIALSSLFIYRPFCRYVCPLGALLGLTSLLRIKRFKVCKDGCIECSKSQKECELGAFKCPSDKTDHKISIDATECIVCGECRNACPKGVVR